MGLADAFNAEDRVNVEFSDFYKLVQQAGKYENVMNGVKCNVPHRYIREMVSGVSEEPQQEEGKLTETQEQEASQKGKAIDKNNK